MRANGVRGEKRSAKLAATKPSLQFDHEQDDDQDDEWHWVGEAMQMVRKC